MRLKMKRDAYAGKLAGMVWSRGKGGNNFKVLPISIPLKGGEESDINRLVIQTSE